MKKTAEQEANEAKKDLNRAQKAVELLNNPLYMEAVNAMEFAMFEEFKGTRLDDGDVRHELWQRMQLMKQFRGKFEHIVKQGDNAKITLTLLERAKQKIGM